MIESAFGWLNSAAEWIGQFVPKREIVDTTQGAIKFVRGATVKVLGPGAYWYWPYTTKFETHPVARQGLQLRAQTMESTDGLTFIVAALVIFEIRDLERLVAHTYDPDDTIADIAQGAVHDVCTSRSWTQMKELGLDHAMKREVQRRLTPYGVKVRRVTLTSQARAKVLKVEGVNLVVGH